MSETNPRLKLGELIEKLTTSGRKDLDEDSMKEVKRIVKTSDDLIKHLYYLLMTQLEKDHSEIRYSTVLIVNEIFKRSHLFRTLVLDQFQTFMEQTVETDADNPLPPPKNAAKDLKCKTLQFIQAWHRDFSKGYKSLSLAYNYLENCKRIEFTDAQNRTQMEVQVSESRSRQQKAQQVEKANNIVKVFQDAQSSIEGNITELENCLQLLVPSSDDPFKALTGCDILEQNEPRSIEEQDARQRARGIPANFNLTVTVDRTVRITQNADNIDIVNSLKEFAKLLKEKHLPQVQKWLQLLQKLHGAPADKIKILIDLKEKMTALEKKLEDLKIEVPILQTGQGGDSSDDEDDFEEVPEKDVEAVIPPHWRKEYGLDLPDQTPRPPERPKRNVMDEAIDPTSRAAQYKKIVERYTQIMKRKKQADAESGSGKKKDSASKKGQKKPSSKKQDEEVVAATVEEAVVKSEEDHSSSNDVKDEGKLKKEKLLEAAPKVNFDLDLYHWEDEKLETAVQVIPFESHNGFHKPRDDDAISDVQKMAGIAMVRERKIEFTGSFEPVKWACRAPLPSGRLCPRRDRNKCPFHGKIIARDEMGRPVNAEEADAAMLDLPSTSSGVPHWQDPELLKDIEAQIGINLEMPKKRNEGKGKGKKRKHETGLTDIKKIEDTTRSRLEKKVFNKSSVMRVASALDGLDSRKYDDKFGDQWNYSFK